MPDFFIDSVGADIAPPQKLEWQNRALCAEVGFDIFFPGKGGQYKEARQICGGCEVILKCKAWIMEIESGWDDHDRHGMFAGMTAMDRANADPEVARNKKQAA